MYSSGGQGQRNPGGPQSICGAHGALLSHETEDSHVVGASSTTDT
jgi:hypothetical protein